MSPIKEFLKTAMLPKVVKISIRFGPALSSITEQVDVMAYIKEREVDRVVYAANLTVDQIGRCLVFFSQVQGRSRSDISASLAAQLKSITNRQLADKEAKRHAREILQLMRVLEVVDEDLYLTLDGERLLRHYQNSRPKFLDYLAWLLLTRAGWLKVVYETDQLRRSVWYGLSMKDHAELLRDELKGSRLIRRTDSWQMGALLDCLVYLRVLKPWNAIDMRFESDKERLYDVLLRKTFT
jgi:hypothetical protein